MESPTEISQNLIDVEKLIASKNPRLLKIIPKFIINFLKRLIHQDYVNATIYRNRHLFGLPFVEEILREFGAILEVEIRGQDGKTEDIRPEDLSRIISPSGRYIVASNHPLGGLDGLALLQVTGKVRKDVVFPVNDLLMFIPGLKPVFIPINKHGTNADNLRLIHETFASGKLILYFPAGLVSRKQKGVIRDLEWKKTFISQAKKYQRDVIPVHITGRNTNKFYRLANIRKRLGIKANIEMLWLPDEMMRQRGKFIRMTFGPVIPWTTFDKSKSDHEWAAWVKGIVYDLRKKPD